MSSQQGIEYSEQTRAASSSSSSSSSPSSYYSPPREFSFDDGNTTNGNPLLLSAKAVEMTPADEIFFGGHLLPLHLLSHFPRLPSSTDDSDTFTLPIEDFPPHSDRSTIGTTPHVSPSEACGRGNKLIPLPLFGLSRWQRAREVRGDQGNRDKERRTFRFELKQTVKRYARMARLLISFRGKRADEDRESPAQKLASITTSPRNSGLLVRTPELSGTVKDGRVDELQAAIQAAIAYCKKSIAAEEADEGNFKHE